jgi:pimeloyl-ACP methyl ester carboxylesterase
MIKIRLLFPIFIVLLSFTACKKENVAIEALSNYDFGNQVTKIESLGTYSKAAAVQMLQLASLGHPTETTCGYSLYRIHYKTHTFDNSEVIASGLLAIPNTENIKGLVSWQHGTNASRSTSISTPSPSEGLGLSSLFAGNEYILIASDYIGLGVSFDLHPYNHIKSTTNAVLDFLKIGEVVLNNASKNTNHNLYLIGFSQGGSATMALQRALEINNPTKLQLKAAAPIAGPYNLRGVSVPNSVGQDVVSSLFYLGYLSNAYSVIYKKPLSTFIKKPYDTLLPTWYDGSKEYEFLEQNLPPKVSDLFTDVFYNELKNNKTNWFTSALEENETYLWKPKNKVRFYYGMDDVDVSPQETIQAYNAMKKNGANVEIQNVGPFDHNGSLLQALPLIQTWFNSEK